MTFCECPKQNSRSLIGNAWHCCDVLHHSKNANAQKTNKIHQYNWNHWTVNTVSIKPLWTVNESRQFSCLLVVQLKLSREKKIISFNCLFISPLWRDIFQLSPHSIQTNRTAKALILHIFKYNLINHKATTEKAIRFYVSHAWISIKLVLWMILGFHNTSILDRMKISKKRFHRKLDCVKITENKHPIQCRKCVDFTIVVIVIEICAVGVNKNIRECR